MQEQSYVIIDIPWFFQIFNKIIEKLDHKSKRLEYNNSTNILFIKNDLIKSSEFMDEFLIANAQQADLLFDAMKNYDLIIRVQNIEDNKKDNNNLKKINDFIIIPEYFFKKKYVETIKVT